MLFAVLGCAVLGCAVLGAAAEPSLLAASEAGLMHLDAAGRLLAWRPEPFRWWQAWHVATNPRNGTVCWVSAEQDQRTDAVLRCAPLSSLELAWDLPQPKYMRLNTVQAIAFDWVGENWYLTASRASYVCTYVFDACVKLRESRGVLRFFAAYDIPNRLQFCITTDNDQGEYQLERLRLDGSGLRVLPTQLREPSGMALDSTGGHIYWMDKIDVWTSGLFRGSYEGDSKELLLEMETSFDSSRRALDVVGDSVYLIWKNQWYLSSVSTRTKQEEVVVKGSAKDPFDAALGDANGRLLAIKVFSPATQPDVENGCSEENGGCRDLCVPTVVNGTAATTCFCPEGFQLIKLSCQRQYPAYAVVVGAGSLQAVDLQTAEVSTILSNLTDATKLDFFWAGGQEFLLFWVDDGSLFRGRWSPGGPVADVEPLVRAAEHVRVVEVAVDWSQRHLLWLEDDPSQPRDGLPFSAKLSLLDGSWSKTVMQDAWHDPQGLAIIGSGLSFVFSENEWGDEVQLDTRAMTGETSYVGLGAWDSEELTTQPAGIAIDVSPTNDPRLERALWINANTRSIEHLRTVSLFRHRVFQLLAHPSLATAGGLDVLGPRVFWTDRSSGRLWTAHSETGDGVRSLADGTGGRAVRVLHPWRQPPPTEQLCDEQRGGCSHLCLRAIVDLDQALVCACPDGMELGEDQKVCQ